MSSSPPEGPEAEGRPTPAETHDASGTGSWRSRRELLELVLGGAVAALGGLCLRPLKSGASLAEQEGPVAVSDLSRLPAGSARQVDYGGQPVLLIRPRGDDDAADVRAFSAICTHEGCVVGWNAEQQTIRCPCHGGVFDASGKVVEGPPPAPLYPFEVEIMDGKIYVTGA